MTDTTINRDDRGRCQSRDFETFGRPEPNKGSHAPWPLRSLSRVAITFRNSEYQYARKVVGYRQAGEETTRCSDHTSASACSHL